MVGKRTYEKARTTDLGVVKKMSPLGLPNDIIFSGRCSGGPNETDRKHFWHGA